MSSDERRDPPQRPKSENFVPYSPSPRSRPFWSSTPEAVATYNKLRSFVATAESTAEKYQKPPAPVDFSAAKKKVRDQELLANLESFYKSTTVPAETYQYPAEEQELDDAKIELAKDYAAFLKEYIPALEEELAFQKSNRTTMETTVEDVQMNYPLIHEEVEDELERREWFKDTEFASASSK